MTKGEFVCPFDHRSCHECVLYRGRHYYIDDCRKDRGDISASKPPVNNHSGDLQAYFQALESQIEPWADVKPLPERDLQIRLMVINVETGESRVYSLAEARAWEWGDSETVRQIDGIQIDSWDKLIKVLSYKAESGHQEVKLYEAPRFMVLAGG
jgi:hypothetical protein